MRYTTPRQTTGSPIMYRARSFNCSNVGMIDGPNVKPRSTYYDNLGEALERSGLLQQCTHIKRYTSNHSLVTVPGVKRNYRGDRVPFIE